MLDYSLRAYKAGDDMLDCSLRGKLIVYLQGLLTRAGDKDRFGWMDGCQDTTTYCLLR